MLVLTGGGRYLLYLIAAWQELLDTSVALSPSSDFVAPTDEIML